MMGQILAIRLEKWPQFIGKGANRAVHGQPVGVLAPGEGSSGQQSKAGYNKHTDGNVSATYAAITRPLPRAPAKRIRSETMLATIEFHALADSSESLRK